MMQRETRFVFGSTPEKAMESFRNAAKKKYFLEFNQLVHVPSREKDEWMVIYTVAE